MTEMYVPQTLVAPRKYVQGRDLLSSLGKYVEELGKDALVIADMHGAKVNFGTLTQLALEERPTMEINDFIAFCNSVGLATTLEEVGLGGADRDDLMMAAEAATMPNETIHNMPRPLDAQIVCDAMIAADAYGQAFHESE